jgi:hypothetical protein
MRPDHHPGYDPEFPSPEARRRAVAEVLARDVRRHKSPAPPAPALSAGRSSENLSETPASELASTLEKSVTVPPG